MNSIGTGAFGSASAGQASGLTALDLSQTKITSVPNSMVRNCAGLTEVKLPSGVATIDDNAFDGTTNLTTIDLPNTVTTINQNAFLGSGITALDLSQTKITTINQGAFQNTASLTTIKLPAGLTSIGNNAFGSDEVGQASGITALDLSQTKVAQIQSGTFQNCASLTEVKLPSTVTSISDNAFKGTTLLKTLTQAEPTPPSETPGPGAREASNQLASTLESIGNNAFQGTGLASIDLSKTKINGSDKNLGNGAFQDAASLSDIQLPTGLTKINAATFAGTVKLEAIAIPSTVTTINAGNANIKGAFQGSGLTSIDLSGTKIVTSGDNNTN